MMRALSKIMPFFVPGIAFADQVFLPPIAPGILTIGDFVQTLLSIMVRIGVPVGTIFIIYSGFLFVTAQGQEAKITKARATLVWTLVGLAVTLGAWALAGIIQGTVNQLM